MITIHIPPFASPGTPATPLTPTAANRTHKRKRRDPAKEGSTPRGPPRDRYRLFQCWECGGTFTTSGHLKRHMEAHGADRRHKCDQCSASYSRQDNLLKHLEVHSNGGVLISR
ncbi:hypothetical protein C7M84_012724 [Penaeus vannamei]|uniref:C2H2-type domain-containing protein n=1 Tax=Penaeus vannamei TaxID=6689 RepID=A0A423SY65_PENVA|nr:hypothetical protein C7M84_012724 [Penaeus vannamei]